MTRLLQLLASLVAAAALLSASFDGVDAQHSCTGQLVETIPIHMQNLTSTHPPTHLAWSRLIRATRRTLDISAFYVSLTGGTDAQGGDRGRLVLDDIVAAAKRGVRVRIALSRPSPGLPDKDAAWLEREGYAEVARVDMHDLFGGIVHSKFLVADGDVAGDYWDEAAVDGDGGGAFYVGSANMDWRSLAQVKEIGYWLQCPSGGDRRGGGGANATTTSDVVLNAAHNTRPRHHTMITDLARQFAVLWSLPQYTPHTLPRSPSAWPSTLFTSYNLTTPALVTLNDAPARMFLSASPQGLCPLGRSDDLSAIRAVIAAAREYVYVSVMDYAPAFLYTEDKSLWPVLADDFKRAAHDRGVHVRFLASNWTHTVPGMVGWLGSLSSFCMYGGCIDSGGTIDVRWYTVPPVPQPPPPAPPVPPVPFTRVQHDKYILTDADDVYITTSNMTPDYFYTTAGVTLNVRQRALRDQLKHVFVRDWTSEHTRAENEYVVNNPVDGHRGGPTYPPRIPVGHRGGHCHDGHCGGGGGGGGGGNATEARTHDNGDDRPLTMRRRRLRRRQRRVGK